MRRGLASPARLALWAAAALALGGVAPARADPNPFSTPQHDVDILYAIPLPGTPAGAVPPADGVVLTQRLRVQAASGLQRVDPPSPGTFMLTDGRTGRTTLVEPSLRLATTLPGQGAPAPAPGVRATGAFQRVGTAMIAGNPCTDWRTRDLAGHDSVVCLTEDGMLVRILQDGQLRAQAVRLDRAPQPDALFQVPVGYTLAQAPAAAPPGPPAGARPRPPAGAPARAPAGAPPRAPAGATGGTSSNSAATAAR